MDYKETLDYLYTRLPMFQRQGAPAYKPGLDTTKALDKAFGHPHRNYPCIHVGGTNGKGSTAHTIASVLQSQGYRTGLYTSPHLVDFRERMRVDGRMIDREAVVDFVSRYRAMAMDVAPSFFELTMMMAFEFFAEEKVDIAVIEVGLGGLLDSTNIITPMLSVITNISLDHTAFLGHTRREIAEQKAGIIKPGVPVVIGEADDEIRPVFEKAAVEAGAPIRFADEERPYAVAVPIEGFGGFRYEGTCFGDITGELAGDCQPRNMATVLTALDELRKLGFRIDNSSVAKGVGSVTSSTGLSGRWMVVNREPLTVCDTGHNTGGWEYISRRLSDFKGSLHMVIGFVNDKDVASILAMMPRGACYYFTQASVPRAMDAAQVMDEARKAGLDGVSFETVEEAYNAAVAAALPEDMIFVGGSTFVVADFLARCK